MWRVICTDDIKKHGRGEKERKTEASDFSDLIAIVLDVGVRWSHSRRVHVAGLLQAAAVVDNKGRARTGQAVHRRLVQQNVVADPGVTGVSSSTLLVHRDCPRTGGSVMRQTVHWTARWVQASFMLPIIIIVLVAAAAVVVMVMVIMVVLVVFVVVVVVVAVEVA